MKQGDGGTGGRRYRLLGLFFLLCACAPVRLSAFQTEEAVRRLTAELVPQVERSVGLTFRRAPAVAVRTRDQVRRYLDLKMADQFPPAELRAVERAYRALGLVPDTLDLRRLIVDLYSEQVAGFYDPDSARLFIVRGAEAQLLRYILAHELVHALQDQYMPLSRILKLRRQNDRQMAGQAVVEGQATLASILALAPGTDLGALGSMWDAVRLGIRQQQAAMPVFAATPRILQEGLLFPYVAGADFMRAYELRRTRAGEMPFGDRLPISTEQVLHPSRYFAGERPVRVILMTAPADTVIYEDDFGEFDTRIALESWGVGEPEAVAAAAGWNGDRYRVLGTAAGTVVVWAAAWDTAEDAAQFERALRRAWPRAREGVAGRRWQVDALDLAGVKVVRLVDAPAGWAGWSRIPQVRITRP